MAGRGSRLRATACQASVHCWSVRLAPADTEGLVSCTARATSQHRLFVLPTPREALVSILRFRLGCRVSGPSRLADALRRVPGTTLLPGAPPQQRCPAGAVSSVAYTAHLQFYPAHRPACRITPSTWTPSWRCRPGPLIAPTPPPSWALCWTRTASAWACPPPADAAHHAAGRECEAHTSGGLPGGEAGGSRSCRLLAMQASPQACPRSTAAIHWLDPGPPRPRRDRAALPPSGRWHHPPLAVQHVRGPQPWHGKHLWVVSAADGMAARVRGCPRED